VRTVRPRCLPRSSAKLGETKPMDPLVFELVGGLLVGAMVWLTVLRRPRSTTVEATPMLAIRKSRSSSSNRRRKSSLSTGRNDKVAPKSRGKPRSKTVRPKVESSQTSSLTVVATSTVDTCPSCGLQAPGTLLAEHFLGSPSHRNGPEKIVVADQNPTEINNELKKDDSKQSVRDLLQILVPPRAFGLRHAHRSVSPVSSVVHDLGPNRRSY
jgi:hypothetical protein